MVRPGRRERVKRVRVGHELEKTYTCGHGTPVWSDESGNGVSKMIVSLAKETDENAGTREERDSG